MKILIDARFYGLENAGLGRYTMNLIDQLQKLDRQNQYIIFLRKKYYDSEKFENNFQKVLCDIPHYSVPEQFELPKLIKAHNPDLTHFLHFNVPLNFDGTFIVTIHDMTMHNAKADSSNLFLPLYFIKKFAYKKVFKHAVVKAHKVIVPSQFVKDELVENFKVEKYKQSLSFERKIKVT